MPKLPFIDFQVPSVSGIMTLNNNQSSPMTIFTLDSTSFRSLILEYSIQRGGITETGQIILSTDGINLNFSQSKNDSQSDPGVVLMGAMSGGTVLVQYVSTNTGQNPTFRYAQRVVN